MLNTTFNNISDILWLSVLLVEETEYSEKITDLPQVTDKLYHIIGAFTIVPEVKMLILPLVTNGTIVSQRFHW